MLMRTDPFRDLDRLTQQLLGTARDGNLLGLEARCAEDRAQQARLAQAGKLRAFGR
mgnify:CR=1 FL=1